MKKTKREGKKGCSKVFLDARSCDHRSVSVSIDTYISNPRFYSPIFSSRHTLSVRTFRVSPWV